MPARSTRRSSGGNSPTSEFVSLGATPGAPLVVTPGPSLAQGRYGHVALPLPDGRVLISGGSLWDTVANRLSARSTVELFSPATNAFTSSTSLSEPRGAYDAALLPNGYVVHVGGSNGSRPVATIDVLRP